MQAMDRAHRIGQKKEVQVFRFCTESSIEEKVSPWLPVYPSLRSLCHVITAASHTHVQKRLSAPSKPLMSVNRSMSHLELGSLLGGSLC